MIYKCYLIIKSLFTKKCKIHPYPVNKTDITVEDIQHINI